MNTSQIAKMQLARKSSKRKPSPTHTIRTKSGAYLTLRLTRKLAIACFCTECLGWEDNPMSCTAPLCPLYPFRSKTLRTIKGNKPAKN